MSMPHAPRPGTCPGTRSDSAFENRSRRGHGVRARVAAAVAGCVLAACSSFASAQSDASLAITNARIIDVDRGIANEPATILIDGGRIVDVLDAGEPLPERFDRVVNAGGRYALPGLIDSHVHYIDPESYGPMMLAHGVALVRDLGSDTRTILGVRDQLNAGERLGPRMIATGAIIDGNPPVWPFSEAVDTADEARAAVDKLADAGVDQIKLYSRLPSEAYHAAVERALERGLLPVGHVPMSVPIADAARAGQATVEHLTGFDMLAARILDPEQPDVMDFRLLASAIARSGEIPDATLREAMRPVVDARTAQVPTLVVFEGIASITERDGAHPMDRFINNTMREFWNSAGYAEWSKSVRAQIGPMHRLVGMLHEQGVPIIAGTDLANPYVYAGYSLHHEIALLVSCGLSEAEALAAATTVPAALFGLDDLGRIEKGYEASLILLDANPLEDIAHTLAIDSVVTRGEHRTRAQLDALLEQAERAATRSLTPEAEGDTFGQIELPGRSIAAGRFAMKFGEWDAGGESFRVHRSGDGFHLLARTEPQGGGQMPALITIDTDRRLGFVRATRRELRENAETATYELETVDGERFLVATLGDEVQRFAVPDDAVIAGPAMSSDAMALLPLRLDVGETVEKTSVSFGVPTWRVSSSPNTITRLPNERAALPSGERVEVQVFRQQLEIEGMGSFDIRTKITAQGLIVGMTMQMPFGTLTAELVQLD